MSTVHATHASDTLNRLETMGLMSDVDMPLYALRAQVASAINFVVHAARLGDGSRCVTEVTEVLGFDAQTGYRVAPVFERRYLGRDTEGRIRSEIVPTGHVPRCAKELRGMGYELPACVYEAEKTRRQEKKEPR